MVTTNRLQSTVVLPQLAQYTDWFVPELRPSTMGGVISGHWAQLPPSENDWDSDWDQTRMMCGGHGLSKKDGRCVSTSSKMKLKRL